MKLMIISILMKTTTCYDPYPYNPKIHTLGNHGFLGKIHAEIAPLFTKFTDKIIYERNIRQQVIDTELKGCRVLDIGCGVGFSTSDVDGSVGLDTSTEMVEKGRKIFPDKEFIVGHGEQWIPEREFDCVSSMFMFHELPQHARLCIVDKAKKIADKRVIVVDISPTYIPSKSMLMGEPYLLEYKENICADLNDFTEHVLVDGHVHMWVFETCENDSKWKH